MGRPRHPRTKRLGQSISLTTRDEEEESVAYLSVLDETGVAVGCANPIFVVSDSGRAQGARLVFEVFEEYAASLRPLLGKFEQFLIDPAEGLFFAQLTSLEPCRSTHPGLARMRDRATLRAVLTIQSATNLDNQPRDS